MFAGVAFFEKRKENILSKKTKKRKIFFERSVHGKFTFCGA